MAFSDCSDSSDPCIAKARSNAVNSVVQVTSAFAPITLITSNCLQVEVLNLPFKTSYDEINTIFSKYGSILEIILSFKVKENSANCYITFENESDSVSSLAEHERQLNGYEIIVRKINDCETKGKKRMRSDEKPWGLTTASSNDWGSTTTSSAGDWGSSSQSAETNSWGKLNSGFGDGGSRGRGGRGGGRACFNCGDEGHMSRECTKPKAGGGGGGRGGPVTCFKCGEEGHMSRECPKGGGRACFNCGEEGHMSRECTKPREAGRGRGSGRGRGGRTNDSYTNSSSEWGTSCWSNNEANTAAAALDW